jgi:hypothetical protein
MTNESPETPVAPPRPSASTGPRTEAGKAVSSRNARKHDLCSRTLNLTSEEWEEYNDMAERYRRDLQPANDVEQTLIDEICFNYWRLQQAREAELHIIAKHPSDLQIIALYIRYYKALDKLQQTQRIRKHEEMGVERLRSAKSPQAHSRPSAAAPKSPSAPVRSEMTATETALLLKQELEDHLLESRVRSEFCLPALPLPAELARRVKEFVSQNPSRAHKELEALLNKAA